LSASRGRPAFGPATHPHPEPSRPVIKAIKFASIPTRDQDAALEFWTTKIGFQVATDQPFDDTQRWIELRIPGADTKLVLFTPKGHEERIGGFSNVTFLADDVQRTYEELRARGVEFVQPAKTEPWGTSAIMKDQDGNVFVISSK
jgi:catechol 2,3-dioxygenase-like lactoylglutathione lyase family enzyme